MKIFVITLPAAKARQENIKLQLETLGLSFDFFYGVDGRKMSDDEILKYYDSKKANKYLGRDLTRGEIGCALSHKYIYEKMISDDIQRAIVLEDDIIINDRFANVISFLENSTINNYIVKLDSVEKQAVPWHKIRLDSEYSIEHPLSSVTYTWGYYIDIMAAKTMSNILEKIFLEADQWLYFKSFIKLRILNRPIIFNNSIFDSEIGERGKNHCEYVSGIAIINKIIKFIKLLITIFH